MLIRNPAGITCQLEAAQAGMLELINQGTTQAAFLEALLASCVLQQHQDSVRAIHWSRYLLVRMAGITGAKGVDRSPCSDVPPALLMVLITRGGGRPWFPEGMACRGMCTGAGRLFAKRS